MSVAQWEGSTVFARALRDCWDFEEEADDFGVLCGVAAQGIAKSRVLVVESEQLDVLPPLTTEEGIAVCSAPLPFDPLLLEVKWTRPHRRGTYIAAVCLAGPSDAEGGLLLMPLAVMDQERYPCLPIAEMWGPISDIQSAPDEYDFGWRCRSLDKTGRLQAGAQPAVRFLLDEATAIALKTLYFLQSANVDLERQTVSRQVRRRAERDGAEITYVVKVRSSRRSQPRGGPHRDYSHRFERRGHYKHFPLGTRTADANPDKLVDVPGRGVCRRIWCPPHVVGPEHKPLIPKRRVVVT